MKLSVVRELALSSLVALVAAVTAVALVILTHGNLNTLAFGVVVTLFVLAGLLGIASWAAGMIKAANIGRWDWLVAVLLLGAPAALALALAQSRTSAYSRDIDADATL